MSDLRKAAEAVLDRWDSPAWEWIKQGPTAELMATLRTALAAEPTVKESLTVQVETLREENERLRDELRQSSIDTTRAEVERLREEIDALRVDAERYRWLREESKRHSDYYIGGARWMVSFAQGGMGHNLFGEKIDAAIDKGMEEAALRREGT